MRLKVGKYNQEWDLHDCYDEKGHLHRVDLFVNGDFPKETAREYLVGKTVEVEDLHPYQEIGMGVKLLD